MEVGEEEEERREGNMGAEAGVIEGEVVEAERGAGAGDETQMGSFQDLDLTILNGRWHFRLDTRWSKAN